MKKVLQWLGTATVLMAAGQASNAAERATSAPSSQSSAAAAQVESTRSNELQVIELVRPGEDQGQAQGRRLDVFGMLQRLADPDERPAVRAEQRASLAELYADTEAALGIDAATGEQLLDLLVDKQLADFDTSRIAEQSDPADSMQALADADNEHLAALRELLGEEVFDRFQSYKMTLGERRQANLFDARLDPADKLQPAQKERLIELLVEQNRELHDHERLSPFSPPLQQALSVEEMRRVDELQTIAANEETWRRLPEVHQRLARQAAEFLTPPQLAVLEGLHAEQMSSLQQWLEQARAQAGLSPTIPERSDVPLVASKPTRTPIAGAVKVDFTVQVNRSEPVRVSHVGANGNSVTFEAGDGLFIEATPTLYDDWLDVRTTYYEQASNGKRRRIGSGAFGTLVRLPDGTATHGGGGGGTVVMGSKAYVINETATAAAM